MHPKQLFSLHQLITFLISGCDKAMSTDEGAGKVATPTCPVSAFTDDSIVISEATPGARCFGVEPLAA